MLYSNKMNYISKAAETYKKKQKNPNVFQTIEHVSS